MKKLISKSKNFDKSLDILLSKRKNKLKRKKITQIKKIKFNFSSEDVAPILRGLLSENKDNKFILNFRKNNQSNTKGSQRIKNRIQRIFVCWINDS